MAGKKTRSNQSSKKASRATKSAIQEVSEEVRELDAIDKVEQCPKKRTRKGIKNQPSEQQPKAAVETPVNVSAEAEGARAPNKPS